MNDVSTARVWRGWRTPSRSWDYFVKQLASVFIPATWQVMGRLGLRCYVASVLTEAKPRELPDEVALLFYPDHEAYLKARDESVAGRAYTLMHAALFSRSEPHVSTTSEAQVWRPGQAECPGATWWRKASGEGVALTDPRSTIVFVALTHGTSPRPGPDAVFAALGYPACEAVMHSEDAFTLVWIGVPGMLDVSALAAGVSGGIPHSLVAAAHVAMRPVLEDDYFEKSSGVSVQADQTVCFCAS